MTEKRITCASCQKDKRPSPWNPSICRWCQYWVEKKLMNTNINPCYVQCKRCSIRGEIRSMPLGKSGRCWIYHSWTFGQSSWYYEWNTQLEHYQYYCNVCSPSQKEHSMEVMSDNRIFLLKWKNDCGEDFEKKFHSIAEMEAEAQKLATEFRGAPTFIAHIKGYRLEVTLEYVMVPNQTYSLVSKK